MKYRFKFLLILIFVQTNIYSFSQNDYQPPLDIPLVLASNFGELRPNHFHMGVDFKTNGKIGLNLYSVKEGYVRRIVVSPYGYGKVIYIAHPNGVTSVYAHCDKFYGKIEEYVNNAKIKQKENIIDLELEADILPVKKGEIIGISGNTGGSTAPHLHFELRETLTDIALNPLKHGFELEDNIAPEIKNIKVYALTKEGYRYPNKSDVKKVISSGNNYTIEDFNIPSNYYSKTGGIGFSVDAIDKLNGANNKCGIYRLELFLNGDLKFAHAIDKVPFETTRFVNVHKDYEEYAKNSRNFHKAFKSRENQLPIYSAMNGVLKLQPGEKGIVLIKVYDAKGNISEVSFKVNILEGEINSKDGIVDSPEFILPGHSLIFKGKNVEAKFDKNTVYEPMEINQKELHNSIGNPDIPVHNSYKLILKNSTNGIDTNQYLLIKTAKGRYRTINCKNSGKDLIASMKYFGSFSIKTDTIAPKISFIKQNAKPGGEISWKIRDGQSGLNKYYLNIGTSWVPLDYEYKNSTLKGIIPKNITGTNYAVLTVVDNAGNKSYWRSELVFD